ncbi:MAG: hypothetical protein K5905_20890 [Roseibium sp.]|uniref:hypothetical protein n=1 Tax=Roseibium sp. TaxID=1936156 RepID=UPI00261CEA68|nr:hypothetical protein [Roseibium sp.]MCV0427922.1 hypothetical protein [Roseibium sp.]
MKYTLTIIAVLLTTTACAGTWLGKSEMEKTALLHHMLIFMEAKEKCGFEYDQVALESYVQDRTGLSYEVFTIKLNKYVPPTPFVPYVSKTEQIKRCTSIRDRAARAGFLLE